MQQAPIGTVAGAILTGFFRIRMAIWTLCLTITNGEVVEITNQATFVCNAPKNIAPALLRVNQQIYEDAKAILYTNNVFSVKLNEGSCMGLTRETEIQRHAYAIPSLWNAAFRQQIYLIRQWRIVVVLNYEVEKEGLSLTEGPYQLQQTKTEFASIVSSALEELCNVLSLSNHLGSMEVWFRDLGRPSLRTAREHMILLPLSRLKVVHEFEAIGVPKNFGCFLKGFMTSKQGEMLKSVWLNG